MPSTGSGAATGVVSVDDLTAYPTADEVADRLEAMGITVPSDAILNAILNASITAWENATGYHPFLNAEETVSTRYFPVCNRLIDFKGGIIAVPTSLTAGGYYNESGVYSGGTVQVVRRDFLLKPDNALAEGKPYNYCLIPGWYDTEKSPDVAIVAPFGYCSALPADVWEAILEEAVLRAASLDPVNVGSTMGVESVKQGPVEWKYGSSSSSSSGSLENLMSGLSQIILPNYRRLRIA